jgi:hypothetical protein
MRTSSPLDSFREIDQVKELRDNPSADTAPGVPGCNERALCEKSLVPRALDEDGFETFIDGAGV